MRFRLAFRSIRGSKAQVAVMATLLSASFTFLTVVLSLVSGVLLRPLPFERPSELVLLNGRIRGTVSPEPRLVSWVDLRAWREALDGVPLAVGGSVSVLGAVDRRQVVAWSVAPGFLTTLGVPLAIGRDFVDDDQQWFRSSAAPRPAAPVIVTEAFFARAFGADHSAIGSTRMIRVGEHDLPMRLVGVLPSDFVFPHRHLQPDLLGVLPESRSSDPTERSLFPIARVSPEARTGVADRLTRAAGQVAALWRGEGVRRAKAQHQPFDAVELLPLSDYLREREREQGVALLVAASLVWLMTTSTVLFLARARARRRSFLVAIQLALGASPRAVLGIAVAESLIIAGTSSVLAMAVSWPVAAWVRSLLPDTLLLLQPVRGDIAVLAVLGAVAAVTILLVALASVVYTPGLLSQLWRPSRIDGVQARLNGSDVLLAAQVGAGLFMVLAGAQMIASFTSAASVGLGFQPDRLIAVGLNSSASVSGVSMTDAVDRLSALHQVEAVGAWTGRLLGTAVEFGPGPFVPAEWEGPAAPVPAYGVTRSFFDVLALPVVAGRIPHSDRWTPSAPVAVVSQRAARMFWPDGNWVGRQLIQGHGPSPTVLAVVGDARYRAPDAEPLGAIFVPSPPATASASGELLMRTSGPAAGVLADVKRIIEDTPPWKVAWAATGTELARESIRMRRLRAALFGAFGFVGLVTLMTGMLGLLLQELARRAREIAIRLCLGASTYDIAWLLGRRLALPCLAGGAAGIVVAGVAAPFLTPYLFGHGHASGPLLGLAVAAIAAVTVAAVTIPAVRYSRSAPTDGLRAVT